MDIACFHYLLEIETLPHCISMAYQSTVLLHRLTDTHRRNVLYEVVSLLTLSFHRVIMYKTVIGLPAKPESEIYLSREQEIIDSPCLVSTCTARTGVVTSELNPLCLRALRITIFRSVLTGPQKQQRGT